MTVDCNCCKRVKSRLKEAISSTSKSRDANSNELSLNDQRFFQKKTNSSPISPFSGEIWQNKDYFCFIWSNKWSKP